LNFESWVDYGEVLLNLSSEPTSSEIASMIQFSKNLVCCALAGLLAVAMTFPASAAELKVGEKVPAFEAKDAKGVTWKSSDHVGKKFVVVYFYPADMTGGCTKQACAFRDDLSKLAGSDVEVVGVSGDSVRNHQLFAKKHDLNFTLLADTEAQVAETFGVPYTKGEKSVKAEVDGKEETLLRKVTIQRWTFIIDKEGKVAYKNTKVAAADDSKTVAEVIAGLKK
jgi:peroxiredoxin Q/BCP